MSPEDDSDRTPRPAKVAVHPLTMSKSKRMCKYCGHEAVVELFRDSKCLACQVSDYIGPIK